MHLERDLPALIEEVKRSHGDLGIRVTAPLDGHPGMIDALVDRSGCERHD